MVPGDRLKVEEARCQACHGSAESCSSQRTQLLSAPGHTPPVERGDLQTKKTRPIGACHCLPFDSLEFPV